MKLVRFGLRCRSGPAGELFDETPSERSARADYHPKRHANSCSKCRDARPLTTKQCKTNGCTRDPKTANGAAVVPGIPLNFASNHFQNRHENSVLARNFERTFRFEKGW